MFVRLEPLDSFKHHTPEQGATSESTEFAACHTSQLDAECRNCLLICEQLIYCLKQHAHDVHALTRHLLWQKARCTVAG